jgi:hypothetical protein
VFSSVVKFPTMAKKRKSRVKKKNRQKSPYFEGKKSEVSIFRQYCTFLVLTKTKQAFKNVSSQI